MVAKFIKLTRRVLPEEQRNDLVEAVLEMESLSSSRRLVDLMRLTSHERQLVARLSGLVDDAKVKGLNAQTANLEFTRCSSSAALSLRSLYRSVR